MAASTANRLPGIESEAERLGFATLGPLAVAYCQWLHAWEQQHPNAKIHFLARDMYLMRQVYALLYPQEQTSYLQVPAAACARFYWRSTGGICCWPLCRANPLPVRRSPPIAVPPARWTCKKNPMI